jgi:hypothetical protein
MGIHHVLCRCVEGKTLLLNIQLGARCRLCGCSIDVVFTLTDYGLPHQEGAKAEARQALSQSVAAARQTVTRLQGTQNPELRPLLA